MTRPVRVQLKRTAGWRMPPNTVKVDRTTMWGNPWTVPGDFATNKQAVTRFKAALLRGPAPHPESYMGKIRARLGELRGKNLACWCRPGEACHADVLLELANK